MLERQEQIQRKGYPAARIWTIREGDEGKVVYADLVIANLTAEYLGVERLVKLVKKSRATFASVLIWERRNKRSLALFTGKREIPTVVTAEEVISAFQENWMDLIYMRENIEEDGAYFTRLDFRAVGWE